jgi:5-carboxymethyl-2-hydroxymuconate isomerase
MGLCPCPRCLIPKALFDCLGLVRDMKSRIANLRVYAMAKVVEAREFIYGMGNIVDGAKVEDTLGEGSWVPILVSTTILGMIKLKPILAESIC